MKIKAQYARAPRCRTKKERARTHHQANCVESMGVEINKNTKSQIIVQ